MMHTQLTAANSTQGSWLERYLLPGLCLAVCITALLIRIRFLDFPLERDEGEYAYMGSLILEGIAPYAESYNMKMPGIYAVYALVMSVFGQSVTGIKTGLILFVLTSTYLVFLLGRHWFDRIGGYLAAALYSVAALLPEVHGVSANAEQFLLPFALAGTWLVVRFPDNPWLILAAGLLMGLATVVKQHGLMFSGFAGIYLLVISPDMSVVQRLRQALVFGCGFLLTLAVTFAIMMLAGVFDSFWFWTFEYALAYASQVPPVEGMKTLALRAVTLVTAAPVLWLVFAVGLVNILRRRSGNPALAVLLLVSLLATVPGFYFRPHYFILLMPAVSLVATAGLLWLARLLARIRPGEPAGLAVLLVVLAGLTLFPARHVLLLMPLEQASRVIFGANPFVESREIADYIQAHTAPDDRIGILGSEPQIYFLAERRAATGYIYTYALMEDQPFSTQMQQDMISELRNAMPSMLVYVNVPNSWLTRPGSDKRIFTWSREYLDSYYRLVGQVLLSPGGATYYWDDELPADINLQRMGVYVYRRLP